MKRGPSRRRWTVLVVVLALIAAGIAVAASGVLRDRTGKRASADHTPATSLATVERRSLSTRTQFNGTWGYARSYVVVAQAHGTVTWLPPVGRVVRQGQILYRVNGAPVVLLYGSVPSYRTLGEGLLASDVRGRDVAQLNHDLVALRYVRRSYVASAWDDFSWATQAGVEKLQKHLRLAQSGRLGLGRVVFLPTPARVTMLHVTLGGPAGGPVLSATSTRRTVSVALDAGLQGEVQAGNRVAITLPSGRTTPGTVTSVGAVATVSPSTSDNGSGGSDSGPTVPVTIRPARPAAAGSLDRTPVEVSITDQTVHNVLAVPVTALLARSGGGYAVEVVVGGAHHLVRVRTGLFDDASGAVQVSGAGLAVGQRVVVPGNA